MTDPESKWMLNKKGQIELDYNIQVASNSEGYALAIRASQNPTDIHELIPMIKELERTIGKLTPDIPITADNGYYSDENLEYLEKRNLDGYIATRHQAMKTNKTKIDDKYSTVNFQYNPEEDYYLCPQNQKLQKVYEYLYKEIPRAIYTTPNCLTCPQQIPCTKGKDRQKILSIYGKTESERMRRKMTLQSSLKIYKKRGSSVELIFGHIKHNMRIKEFKTRGLKQVQTQAYLIAFSNNTTKIIRKKLKNNKKTQRNTKNTQQNNTIQGSNPVPA